MTERNDPRFQPGWATPVVVDYSKPTLLAWFLGLFRGEKARCLAEKQGRCPGRDQCHDCEWSAQPSDTRER